MLQYLQTMCHNVLIQGPRGKSGDVGPRGIQGSPVSTNILLSSSFTENTEKNLNVQGDFGQRGAIGESGPAGAQVNLNYLSYVQLNSLFFLLL